ncbi:hypothetical protein [Adhaeribacter terreus]|uniref:DUF3575 domain-containing protein n=1 Tax=Adhaeribacter terreus TaxID=529703 RepID=A0ABW0E5T5_9BACT
MERIKKILFLLITVITFFKIEAFAQETSNDSVNFNQIQLPIVKVGFSGHIGLTGKYDLSVKPIKNINLNLYYGNRSLDYLHLAATNGETWYGLGAEYYFHRYKNTFFSGSLNMFNRVQKDEIRIPNKRLIFTTPLIGLSGINKKSGIYYHVKAGWGYFSKSLDKRSEHSYFQNGLSIDVGVGIGFGIKKHIKPNP